MAQTPAKLGKLRDRFPNLREVFVSLDSIPIDVSSTDVTPDEPFRSIRASGAGNIKIKSGAGEDRTIAILAGETRHLVVLKVYHTGTTATGLEGMP